MVSYLLALGLTFSIPLLFERFSVHWGLPAEKQGVLSRNIHLKRTCLCFLKESDTSLVPTTGIRGVEVCSFLSFSLSLFLLLFFFPPPPPPLPQPPSFFVLFSTFSRFHVNKFQVLSSSFSLCLCLSVSLSLFPSLPPSPLTHTNTLPPPSLSLSP